MIQFADLARGNRGDVSALFDEHVAKWHDSGPAVPLHEWLGLTWGEYTAIVENPRDIHVVLNP
jgi:hypothetical protein